VAREVARATRTSVVSWGGVRRVPVPPRAGARPDEVLRPVPARPAAPLVDRPVPEVPLAVLTCAVRPFAGARPVVALRLDEERRPEAPWREDPARPLARGLRLVAVTVPERYQAALRQPGSPRPGGGSTTATQSVTKTTFAR